MPTTYISPAWLITPLLLALTMLQAEPVPLFDGKTFAGWEGDTEKTWKIVEGAFTAGNLDRQQEKNDFLATAKSYGNFELTLEVKIAGTEGFVNGGIQFWSERLKNSNEVRGFQADFGSGYDGALCDESRRSGRDIVRPPREIHDKALKKEECLSNSHGVATHPTLAQRREDHRLHRERRADPPTRHFRSANSRRCQNTNLVSQTVGRGIARLKLSQSIPHHEPLSS